jgi:nitrite reductase/ring-hydroxylating ferredoxin subunit
MTDTWHKVARIGDLEPEYPSRVKVGARDFALCLVEGEVFALNNMCSHAFALLSDGYLEGHHLFCPLHGGSFDVRTGEAVDPPCYVAVAVAETKVEGDDVYLKVPGDA